MYYSSYRREKVIAIKHVKPAEKIQEKWYVTLDGRCQSIKQFAEYIGLDREAIKSGFIEIGAELNPSSEMPFFMSEIAVNNAVDWLHSLQLINKLNDGSERFFA